MPALFELLGERHTEVAARAALRFEAEATAALSCIPNARPETIPPHLGHCLPWLFAEVFPQVEDEDLCRVAASGLLYQSHVLALDRVIDGDAAIDGAAMLRASLMHERALTLLFPRLAADTPAWELLRGYVHQYAGAVLREREHHGRLAPYPWERFEMIAMGKAAILKASPMMVACIADRADLVPAVEDVLDPYSTAVQLQDDLEDWRSDYEAGLHSYLLTRAVAAISPDLDANGNRPSTEEVGHALFYGGIAEEALHAAAASCGESERLAAELGASGWAKLAGLFRERLEGLSGRFATLRLRGISTMAAAPRAASDEALDRAFARLEQERRAGYREARHSMGFAHDQGFTCADEVQHGIVFQRAVLGWLFGLAEEAGRTLPAGTVTENLEALAALRLSRERGGWSYFPDLPELCPDADDLAQVIHAFLARPAGGWSTLVEEPVKLVLEHHRHPDGSIDTWLIDPEAAPERQERYRTWIERAWGRGVDAEVVANFFSALHRWSADGYSDEIRAGAEYVASRQEDDGSWASAWYVGPHYGTWAACRLLRQARPNHPALARARDFLERTQRPDGGWGRDGRSDPLQTALALLAWLEVSPAGGRVARDATRHLLLVQREDGFWPRDPFIRMNLRRAAPGVAAQWIHYGSATMSTAFACAALLAATTATEG